MRAGTLAVTVTLTILFGAAGCRGPQRGAAQVPVGSLSAPLTMRHVAGWYGGVLSQFEVQPDGRFTWVKGQQARKGRLPAPELDALLKAVAGAELETTLACDAGHVEFSWLDGNGVVQKRGFSYPQGEPAAGLLTKSEELATRYGVTSQETSDIARAVALACPAFDAAKHSDEGYTVTAAHLMARGDHYVWLVTFKPVRMFPQDPAAAAISMGGGVLVTVDLRTGDTVVTYGE